MMLSGHFVIHEAREKEHFLFWIAYLFGFKHWNVEMVVHSLGTAVCGLMTTRTIWFYSGCLAIPISVKGVDAQTSVVLSIKLEKIHSGLGATYAPFRLSFCNLDLLFQFLSYCSLLWLSSNWPLKSLFFFAIFQPRLMSWGGDATWC